MPYLDEAGLAYYDPKLKEWIASQSVKTIPSILYPWTLTSKAGAVACWPVGGTPLRPIVDFLFTETGPASGTKSPDNPSTIAGVSTITVTRCETAGVDETSYTVNLGGAYYGGTLDVASGVMTVTQNFLMIDSLTGWSATSVSYTYKTIQLAAVSITDQNANLFKCSHFPLTTETSTANMPVNSFIARADRNVVIKTDGLSLEGFKSWLDAQKLAGTPVVITYPLAIPFTVQLTPLQIFSLVQADKYTPRVNTVYTDASSVQVGYIKSPIREEYELIQAIVAQGGNI